VLEEVAAAPENGRIGPSVWRRSADEDEGSWFSSG
jgi:hypothetical protein